MLTSAAEPGAKPQSGLSVIRSGGEVLQRHLHALDDRLGRVDLPRLGSSTQPRPISKSSRSSRKHRHVAGPGRGELHRQVMHLEPVELRRIGS